MKLKHPKANIRTHYTIIFQISLILSLSFMLALTKVTIKSDVLDNHVILNPKEFDPIILPPAIPPEDPPAPIKPFMPVEVPDYTPIVDEPDIPNLELDGFLYQIPEKPNEISDEKIFEGGVEIMPTMFGGLKKLYSEIRYPDMARKAGIEGVVTVQFVVNADGEVENPEILRGICGGCDEEVLRVIQNMRFSPGVQNGNIVKVKMAQSVRFQLQN